MKEQEEIPLAVIPMKILNISVKIRKIVITPITLPRTLTTSIVL